MFERRNQNNPTPKTIFVGPGRDPADDPAPAGADGQPDQTEASGFFFGGPSAAPAAAGEVTFDSHQAIEDEIDEEGALFHYSFQSFSRQVEGIAQVVWQL